MRASKAWIFLLVGILLAGATGFSLYRIVSTARPAAAAAASSVDVVVAKVAIPARTVLTGEILAVKTYPVDLAPPGGFTSVSDVLGSTTSVPVARSQPIVRDQLSAVGSAEVTSFVIDTGKVMVAFPTTDPLTTAGLVNVGDHVDLLATVLQGSGENAKLTQTTLQDLEVVELLAPTKEQPQRQRALVFVVDHQVALVLKYLRDAQTTVDLVIRSRAETDRATTTTVDLTYLMTTYGIKR